MIDLNNYDRIDGRLIKYFVRAGIKVFGVKNTSTVQSVPDEMGIR